MTQIQEGKKSKEQYKTGSDDANAQRQKRSSGSYRKDRILFNVPNLKKNIMTVIYYIRNMNKKVRITKKRTKKKY